MARTKQRGCGFLGSEDMGGIFVWFPDFVLTVDTSTDCHLSYAPLGRASSLPDCHYVQPRCAASSSSSATEKSDPEAEFVTYAAPHPKGGPSRPSTSSKPVHLLSTASRDDILRHLHKPGSVLPEVRPCDTPNGSDTQRRWSAEQLHRATGCRTFKNYKQLLQVTADGEWVDTGEFPVSLGTYSTIRKARRGKPIDRTKYHYLDKVHCDIGFGDTIAVGGARYVLVFVDRATRYNWVFALKTLAASEIINAFNLFRAEAGGFAKCFRTDCDEKLFGAAIKSHLTANGSDIIAAPAGRQSSNGLVESHWKTMIHMSRAYLTEKQMSRNFWFYSVRQAAQMMNMIPGVVKLPGSPKGKLASPFLLVHGVPPDCRSWLPIFSVCYFHHDRDGSTKRSKNQANSMDGIILGRSRTSNAALVYNPRTKKFYEPDSYKIDPHRSPSAIYPDIKWDGGLFCHLKRDAVTPQDEAYPPGTRVECPDPVTNVLRKGTVMNIPLDPTVPDDKKEYLIQFDDSTILSVPLPDMPALIPALPAPIIDDAEAVGLPSFLQVGQKVTYSVDGQFYKGYIGRRDGVYRFSFKRHPNCKHEEWGVPIVNFASNWVEMCQNEEIFPSHVTVSSFLRGSNGRTTDVVANYVSAVNLHQDCPSSLMQALADTHPDREVWLQSYFEEKDSIEGLGTFQKLTLGQYRALREKGAPRAIPTMCVLTIKKDENLLPLRAKSRIVVLGNHEDRIWSKSERFAPVIRADSLRFITSMAVNARRTLKQGDVANAFCNSDLPPEEVTIVRPPIGDPSAAKDEFWLLKKTLYGLRRSPKHWYEKIDRIFRSMGLRPNLYDPCVYTGFIHDPSDPAATPAAVPITVGLYVDDFVYFSTSDEVEKQFQSILSDLVPVDFMGTVEWFLGQHFQWHVEDSHVSVHLNQSGFARNLVESFQLQDRLPSAIMTPYRSGHPIDAIAGHDPEDTSPAFLRRKEAYQSIVGSIGWLVNCTRPDLAAVHSFLSSYNMCPAVGHMKSALYALHYIHSTSDYGISFTSKDRAPIHTYLHYPDASDAECFDDARPPKPDRRHLLTTYSDACWGSQIGNAVPHGVGVPLFKFRSMSGAIIFRSGGPIAWKGERQEKTSGSSCEAEIRATNLGCKLTMGLRNFAEDFSSAGVHLHDCGAPTSVYNDNQSCVNWSHNLTMKNTRHMELKENSVRELVQEKALNVLHVAGKDNPSDIFTKEMKDGVHFRHLRDSFMSSAASFFRLAQATSFSRL